MTARLSHASIPESLTPEQRFAVRCVRNHLGTNRREHLEPGEGAPVDWAHFDQVVHRHHLRPLVYRVLSDEPPGSVPSDRFIKWESYCQQNAKENLYLSGELRDVLDAFEDRGIRAMPFKGPVLAARAYGNISLREFADIDIIIGRDDFNRAKSILRDREYDIEYKLLGEGELTPTQESLILEFGREYEFFRETDGIHIDLHWRFLPRRSAFGLSFGEAWQRRESIDVAGDTVPSMSVEDTLLMLGVHGTRHCWRHLRETCDIAALVTACRIDWEAVVRRAESLGCLRRLGIGLELARTLLGVEIPTFVEEEAIASDPTVSTLVRDAKDHLFDDGSISTGDRIRFKYRAHERRGDRLSFLLYWSFYPHRKEIEWVPLPAGLAALYHLVRPIRLLKESYEQASGQSADERR